MNTVFKYPELKSLWYVSRKISLLADQKNDKKLTELYNILSNALDHCEQTMLIQYEEIDYIDI